MKKTMTRKLLEARAEIESLKLTVVALGKKFDDCEAKGIAHMQAADSLRIDNADLRNKVGGYRTIAETYRKMLERTAIPS